MPLLQTRAWSGVPGDLPLLEILFLFQNFPMDAVGGTKARELGASSDGFFFAGIHRLSIERRSS